MTVTKACRRKPRRANGNVSGIAYHRKRKGLNQTQLAALIGTRQCAICLYESGKRTPSLQVLRRLSAVLDVAIDDLVQTYEVAEDESEEFSVLSPLCPG